MNVKALFFNAELEKYASTDASTVQEIVKLVGESTTLTYLKSGVDPDIIWRVLIKSNLLDQHILSDALDKMIRALQKYESFASDKEAIKAIFRDQDGD